MNQPHTSVLSSHTHTHTSAISVCLSASTSMATVVTGASRLAVAVAGGCVVIAVQAFAQQQHTHQQYHLSTPTMSPGYINLQAVSPTQPKLENGHDHHHYLVHPSNRPVKASGGSAENVRPPQAHSSASSSHHPKVEQQLQQQGHYSYNPSNKPVESTDSWSTSPEHPRREVSTTTITTTSPSIYHTPSSARIHHLPSTATLLYMSPSLVSANCKASGLQLRNGVRPRYNRARIGLYTVLVGLALVLVLLVTLHLTGLYRFL